MIVFGLVSSAFDVVTFALLLKVYGAGEKEFQTAWFVVSLLTEIAVVFSLRTRVLAIRSMPGKMLIGASLVVSAAALAIPYMGPLAQRFGFVPLPLPVVGALLVIVLIYVGATEFTKLWFYKTHGTFKAVRT
jgi:P-type Mg2+ transporter